MLFNPRSINNKVYNVMVAIVDNKVDIAGICETWLTDNHNPTTAMIKSFGYSIIHTFRNDQRGGGTAVIYKACYTLSVFPISKSFKTFEFVSVSLKTVTTSKMVIVILYRTGPVTSLFVQEVDTLLSEISSHCDNYIVAGDMNIHFEISTNKQVRDCSNVFKSFGMAQRVVEPTHINGGILDQIFTYSLNRLLSCSVVVDVDNILGSDHYPVYCELQLNLQKKSFKELTYRNIKGIDAEQFKQELSVVLSNVATNGSFCSSVNSLSADLTNLLDKHAPFVTKNISVAPDAPWFDKEYRGLRCLRRNAEEKYRKSKTLEDQDLYKSLCVEASVLANRKKKQYFSGVISKANGNSKALFQLVNKELDSKQEKPLPDNIEDIQELASKFNNFFAEKVDKIRANLRYEPMAYMETNASNQSLREFEPVTIEELREIIKDVGIKCSPADMLPESLLKTNIAEITPVLVDLVNLSLRSGSMEGVKVADIIPLIKDTTLDPNIMLNYRPVSNLTFLGKLIEQVVLKRLNEHLTRNNLHIPEQSAYKKHNSTETLLVRIANDILIASDEKSATVVMLLDLSAAFDTVDHSLLLRILETEIGIKDGALKWFKSFLTGRSQRIRIGSTVSDVIVIKFGVPQGSVLGPVLFNIYIRSIYGHVKRLGFAIYGYADDHQIFKKFNGKSQTTVLINELSHCFKNIQRWMNRFYLKLNATKTQIIVFGPPNVLQQININGTQLTDGTLVRFVSTVKNLGVRMDESLTMEKHVRHLKSKCFQTIRKICKVRFLLTQDQLKTVVNSLVVTCLDYCNGLFYGINENALNQLQLIQNAAAKLITGKYKHDHLDTDLNDLHWLEVKKRILFKIGLLSYKALNGIAPMYLQELIHYSHHGHSLQLSLPKVSSKHGLRAFSVIGPKLYNSFPPWVKQADNVEIFKKYLKTYLFNLSQYDLQKFI